MVDRKGVLHFVLEHRRFFSTRSGVVVGLGYLIQSTASGVELRAATSRTRAGAPTLSNELAGASSRPLSLVSRRDSPALGGERHLPEKMGGKKSAKDEESAAADKPRMKRQLSSGQLLVDDPGVLGPFNRLVWAHPNSALYILLVIGAVVFVIMKQNGYSTSTVRSTHPSPPDPPTYAPISRLPRARVPDSRPNHRDAGFAPPPSLAAPCASAAVAPRPPRHR